jgi:hypothetical protein
LTRASDAVLGGELPSEVDLETLAEDADSMSLILERSVDLSPEKQLELADYAVFALSAADDRRLMYLWLVRAAERLMGRSDLLVQLIKTWILADPGGGLEQMRRLLRAGAISLDQRKPAEVALVLREAARTVGDAEALRDAYESLASAPERERNPELLGELLQELEEEDGPTSDELRAIGLPIVLQAFKSAPDDRLIVLAGHAERYVRAYLRSDPPNLESAMLLEPLLVAAHERADPTVRPSLENALRELRQRAGIAESPVAAERVVAVTYEELLRSFEGVSPNLEILPSAYESARKWGKDGTEHLGALRDALNAAVVVANRYASQELGRDGAVGAFRDAGHVLVPDESDSALQNPRSLKPHVVKDRFGQSIVLRPHLRFAQGKRLYLAFDEPRRVVLVGHVGDHLPGKRTRNRPR